MTSTPKQSRRSRRALLTVAGVVPADVDRGVRAGRRPRPDYLELAAALDADLLDVASALEQTGRLGGFLHRVGGAGVLLGWATFRLRRRYETIVTDGEQVGLVLAALCRLGRGPAAAHVMIAHVLSVRKKVLLYRLLRLGRYVDLIFVYSSWQRRFIIDTLGFPSERVILTSFMVDTAYFSNDRVTAHPRRMICSAGLEHRDYPTLLEAVDGLDLEVVIAAASPWSRRRDTTEGRLVPPNVQICQLGFVDLRQLYADALFVVMPLYQVTFQAGVTTILEAMAMSKTVISSGTAGQTDVIVDGETGVYVPPSSAAELRAAITALLDDPGRAHRIGAAARDHVVAEADVTTYAQRLADHITALAHQRGDMACTTDG
jgi:glycosyltransferase involved in cell wall biosynthesis